MMIFILNVLIEMLFGGLLFYIGYRIGYNRGYDEGRKSVQCYWRSILNR